MCNAGERALSGGAYNESDVPSEDSGLELSAPLAADGSMVDLATEDPVGWTARLEVINHGAAAEKFTIFVICTTP
jgi:hypothetical protein